MVCALKKSDVRARRRERWLSWEAESRLCSPARSVTVRMYRLEKATESAAAIRAPAASAEETET
jgi:hypothetical protein